MNGISNVMSGYLHTYEAYRVPKGPTVKNQAGEDVVLSNDEDTLVLTEKSSRQLVNDRRDYVETLQTQAEMAAKKHRKPLMKRLQKIR